MDGHDAESLAQACSRKLDDGNKPLLVIAKTIAGKGVSFMEGKVEWHYMPQTDEQHRKALEEVDKQLQTARAI
jgi:transketolase